MSLMPKIKILALIRELLRAMEVALSSRGAHEHAPEKARFATDGMPKASVARRTPIRFNRKTLYLPFYDSIARDRIGVHPQHSLCRNGMHFNPVNKVTTGCFLSLLIKKKAAVPEPSFKRSGATRFSWKNRPWREGRGVLPHAMSYPLPLKILPVVPHFLIRGHVPLAPRRPVGKPAFIAAAYKTSLSPGARGSLNPVT